MHFRPFFLMEKTMILQTAHEAKAALKRHLIGIDVVISPPSIPFMKNGPFVFVVLLILALIAAGCTGGVEESSNASPTPDAAGTRVLIQTSLGNITLLLYADMPITAGNFEKLSRQGFYNGVIFHRVIDGFMIQGGDPTGTGMGGPGYTITDEFVSAHSNLRGTIAMANAGANTGGSQFFINLVDNRFLDPKHPVFGEVINGMDVVDRIGKVATRNDRPIQNVTILKVTVLE
jgi:peptidylprolyl isomerase